MKPRSKGKRDHESKSPRVEERKRQPTVEGQQSTVETAKAAARDVDARLERREEIQRTLVETMRGILSGRISNKEAWAIGRRVEAELQLLGLMDRLEQMMQREEAESKRAKAPACQSAGRQGSKGPTAQGAKRQSGGKEWVN